MKAVKSYRIPIVFKVLIILLTLSSMVGCSIPPRPRPIIMKNDGNYLAQLVDIHKDQITCVDNCLFKKFTQSEFEKNGFWNIAHFTKGSVIVTNDGIILVGVRPKPDRNNQKAIQKEAFDKFVRQLHEIGKIDPSIMKIHLNNVEINAITKKSFGVSKQIQLKVEDEYVIINLIPYSGDSVEKLMNSLAPKNKIDSKFVVGMPYECKDNFSKNMNYETRHRVASYLKKLKENPNLLHDDKFLKETESLREDMENNFFIKDAWDYNYVVKHLHYFSDQGLGEIILSAASPISKQEISDVFQPQYLVIVDQLVQTIIDKMTMDSLFSQFMQIQDENRYCRMLISNREVKGGIKTPIVIKRNIVKSALFRCNPQLNKYTSMERSSYLGIVERNLIFLDKEDYQKLMSFAKSETEEH